MEFCGKKKKGVTLTQARMDTTKVCCSSEVTLTQARRDTTTG